MITDSRGRDHISLTPWSSAARLSSAAISDLHLRVLSSCFTSELPARQLQRLVIRTEGAGRSAMNLELPANEMPADRQQHDILLEAHSLGVSLPSLTSDPPAWVLDYDGRRDEVRCSLPRLRIF